MKSFKGKLVAVAVITAVIGATGAILYKLMKDDLVELEDETLDDEDEDLFEDDLDDLDDNEDTDDEELILGED